MRGSSSCASVARRMFTARSLSRWASAASNGTSSWCSSAVSYRYYVTREAIADGYGTCAVTSVPAADVEGAVLDHVQKLLGAPELIGFTTFRGFQVQQKCAPVASARSAIGFAMAGLDHDQPIDACPWQVRSTAYCGRNAAERLL